MSEYKNTITETYEEEITSISVPLYSYEDEDTGEIVYDTESIAKELGRRFTQLTGKDWSDY